MREGGWTELPGVLVHGIALKPGKPLAVVLPLTTAEVSALHKLATRERMAITPRAMGSGLSGGAVPLEGSLVLAVMRMHRILEISEADGVAVVQPGVVNADLQRAVEARGLFYPPDPSSLKQSAIGGNVAENAGGARCLKYGVTGDYDTATDIDVLVKGIEAGQRELLALARKAKPARAAKAAPKSKRRPARKPSAAAARS